MLYGRFTFQITFNSEADLPPYKGSTLRGLLGVALKKVVCALKMQECHTCLLRERCLYRIIFEIPAAEGTMVSPSPPLPFIIEPPLELQTTFRPGESLAFNLILLGSVNDSLPYFIYAVDQMGRKRLPIFMGNWPGTVPWRK